MIRSVKIQNWRAYGEVQNDGQEPEGILIDLRHKVVFITAPNGAGKSSLIQATQWCLFNKIPSSGLENTINNEKERTRILKSAINNEKERTRVITELDIVVKRENAWEKKVLRVDRAFDRDGTSNFTASILDESGINCEVKNIDHDRYRELLESAYSTKSKYDLDHNLIANLMFSDLPKTDKKLTIFLKDYLLHVFGVLPLKEAAETFKGKANTTSVEKYRENVESGEKEILELALKLSEKYDFSVLQEELDIAKNEAKGGKKLILKADFYSNLKGILDRSLSRKQSTLNSEVTQLTEKKDEIVDIESRVKEWENFQQNLLERKARINEALKSYNLQEEFDEETPVREQLDSILEETRDKHKEATKTMHDYKIALAAQRNAIILLNEPTTVCPTCLRKFEGRDRIDALEKHKKEEEKETSTSDLATKLKDSSTIVDSLAGKLSDLEKVRTEIGDDIQELDSPSRDEPSQTDKDGLGTIPAVVKDLENNIENKRNNLEYLDRHKIDFFLLFDKQSENIQHLLSEAIKERRFYVMEISLTNEYRYILETSIAPISKLLSTAWESIFTAKDLGLQITKDGEIKTKAGLSLEDLSGGETATLLLMTNLLLLTQATIPTMLVDEPLEHMDPYKRISLATILVRAARNTNAPQLIVTTYEEQIARRLEKFFPDIVRVIPIAER